MIDSMVRHILISLSLFLKGVFLSASIPMVISSSESSCVLGELSMVDLSSPSISSKPLESRERLILILIILGIPSGRLARWISNPFIMILVRLNYVGYWAARSRSLGGIGSCIFGRRSRTLQSLLGFP